MSANTKTLLTVKIDKDLKKRAEKTAASFGLPLGTMVNTLIRRTVEDGTLELITPTASALRRINRVRGALQNGQSASLTLKELRKELLD